MLSLRYLLDIQLDKSRKQELALAKGKRFEQER